MLKLQQLEYTRILYCVLSAVERVASVLSCVLMGQCVSGAGYGMD